MISAKRKEVIKEIEKEREEERPILRDYFIEVLHACQKRATCDRGKSASVIVRDKHIISTGYVGSAAGAPHCDDVGHEFITSYEKDGDEFKEKKHCIRTVHAEQNAICQAAKLGIAIKGTTIYCTMVPCYTCAKMIINCGIKSVIAEYDYQSAYKTKELFKNSNVNLNILNPGEFLYK